jgi:hypothetical protein
MEWRELVAHTPNQIYAIEEKKEKGKIQKH